MERTPSTACWVSGFPVTSQQRVLLFGSVRCEDLMDKDLVSSLEVSLLDSAMTTSTSTNKRQVFGHGRAKMLQHQDRQLYLKSSNSKSDYFTSLRGGTSSDKH